MIKIMKFDIYYIIIISLLRHINVVLVRAAGLIDTCQARGHGFDSWCLPTKIRTVWIIISAY